MVFELTLNCSEVFVEKIENSIRRCTSDQRPIETTKLTQELAVKLEQGKTFVSGTQWQTEK